MKIIYSEFMKKFNCTTCLHSAILHYVNGFTLFKLNTVKQKNQANCLVFIEDKCFFLKLFFPNWQGKLKLTAFINHAFHPNFTAMTLHKILA